MLVGNARIGCQFSVVVTRWTSSFIFVVTQRQARLVPERVTVFGRVNCAPRRRDQAPRPIQPEPALCGRLQWVPGESWGSKQAHRVIQQPISVVSQCGASAWLNGLASWDQRRLTGSDSASEACSRLCAIQIHRLLHFTLHSEPY